VIVDWKTMSPRDVWDSIRSAPRVAGPWEDGELGGSAVRRAVDGTVVVVDGLWATPGYPNASWRVPVGERSDADATMTKNGWVLA
jgi:hypothetical protein